MAINVEHYRKLLEAKERELVDEIARFNEDARESQTAEVEDSADEVVSSQAKAGAFGATDIAADTLSAVRTALQRIELGEYGRCVDCGKEIEPKRLEAVPWTPYCLEDQEKHDKEAGEATPFDAASA